MKLIGYLKILFCFILFNLTRNPPPRNKEEEEEKGKKNWACDDIVTDIILSEQIQKNIAEHKLILKSWKYYQTEYK